VRHAAGIAVPSRRSPGSRALGLLAPPLCVLCRRPLARPALGVGLCDGCRGRIDRSPGFALEGEGIDAGFAALAYSGVGRRLVAALKFSRLVSVAGLGAALIGSRAPPGVVGGAIVPVPAAPLRLAARGFDPARELARALAGATGLGMSPVLRRRDLRHQRGRSRSGRLDHPPSIAAADDAPEVAVLVDDVTTTGATLSACAAELRAAGSRRVHAVTLAAVRREGAGLSTGSRRA